MSVPLSEGFVLLDKPGHVPISLEFDVCGACRASRVVVGVWEGVFVRSFAVVAGVVGAFLPIDFPVLPFACEAVFLVHSWGVLAATEFAAGSTVLVRFSYAPATRALVD